MNKPFLIFVEGSQGVGKSTVCRELREQLKYTTLLDLSAIGDKTEEAQYKMFKYHNQILDMFDYTKFCEMNYVCCRSFLSERIYCNLGFKPYSFDRYLNILINNVDYLTKWYDVCFVLLLATEEDLKIRLNRDKFAYQSFSVESSLAQQKQYQKEFMNLAKMNTDIKVYEIENDNLPRTVNTIRDIVLGGFLD